MISPTPDASRAETQSLAAACGAFFRPGGALERAGAGGDFPIERRPQQEEMAVAIAEAIEAREHLVVEAGTGVGKSFAYLVPAILAAKRRGEKVVISTYTISLQEQLMEKDIPFLQRQAGLDFRAVMVKGRSNYLCLRRLDRARKMGNDMFQAEQGVELDAILRWASRTPEGSLQDMPEQPSSEVWGLVCAEQGNCLWQRCPEYSRCFFIEARQRMAEADLLVVNHHLFFSNLALQTRGASFLPPYCLVVLDEAHRVEAVASEHMGLRLTQHMFHHWIRRLYVPENGKGILAVLRRGTEAHAVTRLRDTVEQFFASLRRECSISNADGHRLVAEPIEMQTRLPAELGQVTRMLAALAEEVSDEEIRAEVQSLQRRGAEMRDAVDCFLQQGLPDHVYWIEQSGRRSTYLSLHSSPIDVGEDLRRHLFDATDSVVMTSATLAVEGKLSYFQDRIGATECRGLQVGSPFNYERQMKVLIPRGMPDPNHTDAFIDAAVRAIAHFTRQTQGRAFVLFTSARMMQDVAAGVGPALRDAGLTLLMQGTGTPRTHLLDRFRRERGCVLFGLDSFWTGVDVRGEALGSVIIARLPFAVPDHPVTQARLNRVRERGGDPFRDYSLPEALLRFRQGVGRLIRTAHDEGIIVVLDGRIQTKWYGRLFLRALPECPIEITDII